MTRLAALAIALVLGMAGEASACLSSYYFRGIAIYDVTPAVENEDTLVLDVVFDRDQVATLNGVVTAHVRQVLRGEYAADTIRVGLGNSSCTSSFEFGREGIIAGELVSVAEGNERAATWPAPQVGLTFAWPFPETVLVPIEETREEREMRLANLTHGPDRHTYAHGDFDGDGVGDAAHFFESNEGALVIGVRVSRLERIVVIWGGDISSLPYFTFRKTGPGVYRNLCHLYGPDCGGAPREVTLTHDGIIVTALEGPSEFLYYWDGSAFRDIIISE